MRSHLYQNQSISRRLILGLVVLMITFIFGISCQAYKPAPAPAPEEKPAEKPPATEERVTLTWEQKNTSFSPTSIEVEVGEKVRIVNRDAIPHTFTAQNPETGQVVVDRGLNGGESVTFIFDTKEVWKVWCTIHSDGTSSNPATSGMKGKVGVGVPVTQEDEAAGDRYQY